MNQVARIPAREPRLLAGVPVPHMAPWLREAMRELANPHPDIGPDLSRITDMARQDAARLRDALDAILQPGDGEAWRKFMAPLAVVAGQAPASRADREESGNAFAFALEHIPGCLLTVARQREMLGRFTWWPKPAQMNEWLQPAASLLRSERALAARIAASSPAEKVNKATPEERAAIAEKMRGLQAEMRARERVDAVAKIRPSFLTPAQERAAFEAAALRPGSEGEPSRRALAAMDATSKKDLTP